MLEFLENYNKYHIYDRAKNAELTLKAFDPITPMATFVEAVMKAAYSDCFGVTDKLTLKNISLAEMFENKRLIDFIKGEYRLTESVLNNLDFNVRRKSNFFKHDIDPYGLTEETFRKDCFKSIYYLATGYYESVSGNRAPKWGDDDFKKLYNSSIDDVAREKLDSEAGLEIKELKKQITSAKKEKAEANHQIEILSFELKKAQFNQADEKELRVLREKVSKLEDEINETSGQSIILKEKARAIIQNKNNYKKELDNLSKFYAEASEEQSQETKDRIAAIEKELQDAKIRTDSLDKKKSELNEIIHKLLLEKQRSDRKIYELGIQTANADAVVRLERHLLEAQAKKEEILERLSEKETKLQEVEKLYKIKASELDKLNEKYQRRQKRIAEAQRHLEMHAPRCEYCNAPLKHNLSKYGSGYYWNCPNYRKDGSGCIGGNVNSNYHYNQVIHKYYHILGDAEETVTYSLSKESLNKFKMTEIKYTPYPESLMETNPPTYLFQSITVPDEVFKYRHETRIEQFSKFFVSTNLPQKQIEDKKRIIYSLALRLLNRGVVLPEYEETAVTLRSKFNKNDFGAINWLFDSAKYSQPDYPYDSLREKAFAEYYFPRLIGENWATFVFAQAGIDALVQSPSEQFKDQKVDFFLYKNGKKVVLEIDGPEHNLSKSADENRDRYLQENNFIVRRFSNTDVDSRSENILKELSNVIGKNQNTRLDVDVDSRYLVASKLCHQFAVAIVKCLEKGYIAGNVNLKAEASTDMFTASEVQFILNVAVAEVYSILKNYSVIYDCTEEWNFFDEYSPEIWLSAGDGRLKDCKSILIRDCTLPNNILCEIENFKGDILPSKADESALIFFLYYTFRFKLFKQGQYEAIRRLIERKDTIVLLPTGSGKSVIYQLSSFIIPGLVVVISPLISLIEDQVQNLERKQGITNSVYFSSATTQDDKERKEKNRRLMQHNATGLIYLAPERLMIPAFREDVNALLSHNSIYAVAIDEAHCVSEWGHSFRPAYLNVGNAARHIFKKNGLVPVISALTGTASDAVLNDVRLDLGIKGKEALIQPNSFDRSELHFSIRTCEASSKDYSIAGIIKNELPLAFKTEEADFSRLQGSDTYAGIVFTPLATKLDSQYSALKIKSRLEHMLPELGVAEYFSSIPKSYDEDTWKTTIRENARKFKDDELNLLVATKAFGMGIDKPNIRYIIHDGLPTSFEQYYQEAGRAGRGIKEGEKAECILLFSNDNEEENEKLLNPELSLSDFKQEYESYSQKIYQNNSYDDVSALLYFHNESFKGIEKETDVAAEILNIIEQSGFSENKTIRLMMPLQKITDDGEKILHNKNDREKEWIQAMVRLLILGIISDYTYDYRLNFKVICGKLDKDSVAEKYGHYVSGNVSDKNRILREKNLIKNIDKTGVSFAKSSVDVLVNYIYDNIEQSRRRAIHEMFDAVKQAAKKTGEGQNTFLRERITQYFKYSGENHDSLKAVETGAHAGLMEYVNLFDFSPDKSEHSEEEKNTAREIYVLAGRVLESKPDHPGLLMAQALGGLISGDYSERVIANNITAAIRFAKERYLVDDCVIKLSSFTAMNTILKRSPETFDELLRYLALQNELTEKEIVSQMIESQQFGDDNREYLLASYALLLINESQGRILNESK